MGKQNKSSIVSGAGFVAGFFTDLVAEVRRLGGTDDHIYRLATPEGKPMLIQLATLIIGKTAAAESTVLAAAGKKFTVDYSQTLAQMIANARFDWVNNDITEQNFPHQGIGTVELMAELVHFRRVISSENALQELDTRGLRPATMAELVAFGANYPNEQRQYPIIALGQVRRLWNSRHAGFLFVDGRGRHLRLGVLGGGWGVDCRFLALRK